MKYSKLSIPEVLLLEPSVFADPRGYFFESFNARSFLEGVGVAGDFVQDNESYSSRGVFRGIHYQIEHPQGKLVRVVEGEVFDVAVDLRRDSPTFGKWVGEVLSSENKRQLWVPPGFGHGFMVLSKHAKFLYKVTDYRYAEHERCIRWDDPEIGIIWPKADSAGNLVDGVIVSEKDGAAPVLRKADVYS
jgi:dTDP-4-dehydrorhamnose 3,5-epimerase